MKIIFIQIHKITYLINPIISRRQIHKSLNHRK